VTPVRRAVPGDLTNLLPLVAEFCAIDGHEHDADRVRTALGPLLGDDALGQVWVPIRQALDEILDAERALYESSFLKKAWARTRTRQTRKRPERAADGAERRAQQNIRSAECAAGGELSPAVP
jgi:hypothetical protein